MNDPEAGEEGDFVKMADFLKETAEHAIIVGACDPYCVQYDTLTVRYRSTQYRSIAVRSVAVSQYRTQYAVRVRYRTHRR